MKNHIKITLFLGLALCSSLSFAMEKSTVEKHQEFIAQQKTPSQFTKMLNRHFGNFLTGSIDSEDTEERYKLEWQRIQNELNIPQEYHLPIKNISPSSIISQLPIGALADTNAAYLGRSFGFYPLGMQKYVLFHEAVHHKYLDAFKIRLSLLGTFSGTLFATKFFTKNYKLGSKWYTTLARTIGSLGISFSVNSHLKKYIEYRADVESAHAVKCHKCLKDVFDILDADDDAKRRNFGYLTTQEFKEIAKEDKRKGNICKQHEYFAHKSA